jgi:signal transduction histidine kinase
MKPKQAVLSRQYATALARYLKHGSNASLQPALQLGSQAVTLGLETLGLARIHEQALATLGLANLKNAFTRLAGKFFNEANRLIEETHRAARQSQAHVGRLTRTLGRRTEELATSNRQVRRAVVQRKVMTEAFAKSGQDYNQSLAESLGLQKRLQQLTHRVLAAQEDERQKISRELQNEIAQTLLGINVRLLSLKQETRGSTNGLQSQIASTQRLVADSARAVRRFARELRAHPPTEPGRRS